MNVFRGGTPTGIFLLTVLLSAPAFSQKDVETYMRVQKARAEVPGCRDTLERSKAVGSVPLHMLPYAELDKQAQRLTHCMFVFRITGDTEKADEAGDESDRYDATIANHLERYLKAKGLWNDFLKNDCRAMSETCGKGSAK